MEQLCAQLVAKDPSFPHADSEDSDQSGRMPRLIWVFAGRTTTLLVLSWGGSFYSDKLDTYSDYGSWFNEIVKRTIRSKTYCPYLSPVKRICVFEHSVMTNFNCACPDIRRGQESGFLSEGSSWLIACMSEQRRFWRDCADAQARLNLRCSHRR